MKNAAHRAENAALFSAWSTGREAFASERMETRHSLWQRCGMIEFRPLPDDHPDLAHSPMLRAALLTLQYAQEHGSIGLTKTKAFKRFFVHWAVEHFDWPGRSAEEMFRYKQGVTSLDVV